jgi:hypothetical protein
MTDATSSLNLPADPEIPSVAPSIPTIASVADLTATTAPTAETLKVSSSVWTAAFWKGAGERAFKTFLQSAVATALSTGVVSGVTGFHAVPWVAIASIAGVATILSVATSIGSSDFTAGVNK